jgi:hypothetical protein
MPRVRRFDAALPQAPNDPYGSHELDAFCFGLDETCFIKLESKGDLVADIWFEAYTDQQPKLAILRRALISINTLAPAIIADYWINAVGEVSDEEFLDAYFRALVRPFEQQGAPS